MATRCSRCKVGVDWIIQGISDQEVQVMNQARPIARRPTQARFMRVFNEIPKLLLRSPLHGVMSGRLLLFEVTGRQSGRLYAIPVAYVEHEGTLLVGAGAPWTKNV